jgi:hypothetical protein
MIEYEYEVVFSYESTFIGAVVYVNELSETMALDTAVYQVWEMNGIDIVVDNCVSVKITHTGTIGG